MNHQKVFSAYVVVFGLLFLFGKSFGIGFTCNGRCQVKPTLFDYQRPIGCYCHSTCGGTLRCCGDKNRYCGSSGGGGEQACLVPKKVDRATVVGGQKLYYSVGETITYDCPYRYEISGSATRTCIGNNIWSPGPPRCKRLTFVCSPPRIRDGDYEEEKKHYTTGDTIFISCSDGYLLEGSETMTCSLNRWIESTPSCVRDRCLTHRRYCSDNGFCRNFQYYAKCYCNEGFEGDGWICNRIPCYQHNCASNEECVDSGDGTGDYTCECKEGYKRNEQVCEVDPCFNNDCHVNATCSVVDNSAVCECNAGYLGNGTYCQEQKCDLSVVHDQEIIGLCLKCEDVCCDSTNLRECRICIRTECDGGEVCGEEGLSRVDTVCSDVECYERDDGYTVDTPDYVKCLDDEGLPIEGSHCCWVGE